jgi:hypothetical protein
MGQYKRRQYQSFDVIEVAGIRIKPYTIAAKGREGLKIDHALNYARNALPESPIPWMRHHGLGYLMYHAGEDGNWFLLRAWVEGDIQVGMICADSGDGFKTLSVPACECVWEAVISHHERDAWVKNMMSAKPDPDAYLADRLVDGMH